MNKDLRNQAKEFTQEHKRRSRWQKVVTCLAAVVVFCTTYALILPAITLERPTTCGKEEHTHTYDNNCYRQVTSIERKHLVCSADVHKHTQDCYDDAGNLICGYADFVVHTHDASCYENGQLVCPLPEIKAHTHDDSCYTVPETHVHGDGCYTQQRGDLTCTLQEGEGAHTHTADCWQKTDELICEQEESEGQTHTEACYDADGNLICGLEESEGHTHTDECYGKELICGQEESAGHQHTDACFEMKQVLTCTESTDPAEPVLTCDQKEIKLHTHTSECYDEYNNLTCGKIEVREHVHTAECFQTEQVDVDTETLTCTNTDEGHEHTKLCYGAWELTCGKAEHTHTEECYAAEEPTEATELTLFGSPTSVEANAGMMLLEDGATAANETRAEFSKYVNGVTYKDPAYNPNTDQVEVSFELTFKIGNSVMHPAGGGEQHKFVYTLPKGVTIPESMLGKTYTGRDKSGAEGFTYEFVKNSDGTYSINIDFIHDYVKDKDNFEGYINFSAYAGATNDSESEYKYTFADNHTMTIKPEEIKHPEGESMHYNIAVKKSASGYNYDENKITYTITVDSAKGTPDPLNLTDVLNLNGLSVDHVQLGSVVVEDRHDEWNMVYGSKKDVSGCTMNYDEATEKITMSLPALGTGSEGKGQRYTITYDVCLDEPAAGSQYTVGNKATVSGTDTTKGETVKDSDETTTTINKDLDLRKSGTYNKDTNTITWVITLNNNRNNIAGSTLTDEMFASITDKNTVKFEPSDGIAWDGNALKFSGVNGDTNNQTYNITYTTPLPENLTFTDGVAVVDNKATVTPPSGEEKDAEASVTIDKTVDVGKKGEYDKSKDRIKWTITVNRNGNNLKDTVLTDTMFNQVPADSIVITDKDGNPVTDGITIVPTTPAEGESATIEKIIFGENAGNGTYTITYYTDVPDPEEGKESVEVKNGSTVTPPDLPPKTDEETVIVNKTVDFSKTGSYDKATDTITWTITVNRNGNDLTDKVLTDEMFAQFADKSQITITPANGYTWDGNNLKFNAVENGVNNQTYTITYTTKSGVEVNKTGTVSNTVGLGNKEFEANVPVDRTITFDKQNGSYDANNKRIWWTIELNTNNQNIYNFVLKDTMFGQMENGTLEVYVNGGWEKLDESRGAYKVYKDANGKVTSIVFDVVGTTGANTNRYTIKYATPAEPKWDSYTVTNTATIDPPGDTPPIEDPGEATVPGEGSVVKKCESGVLTGNQLELTWKMEVKVPSSGLPAGTTITDTLKDGQWMTFQQIQEWGSMIKAKDESGNYATGVNYWWPAGETYTIKFTATDGTEVTYADIVSGENDAHNKKYTGYTITFKSALSAETYGGKTLWIQYKSYADVSNVADTQKYQNTVSIKPPDGNPKDSTASYDYRKAGLYKTDGNGNKESTPFTTADGVLTWKVRVRTSADCDKVTVVDTLPQGVTLTDIKLDNTNLTIDGTQISCEPIWANNNKLIVSGTIEEKTTGDEVTLTLSSVDGSGNSVKIPYRSEFYIYYTCKINPGILNNMSADQATSFTNNVTAKQDDTEFPSDSHTQEVKYDKTGTATKVVEKSGEWVNDSRLLDYSVVLNPAGDDLLEGKDTLALTDTLEFWTNSSTASLIDTALLPGSVKLYKAYYDEEGNLQKGEEIKDWTWKVETKVEDKGYGVQHLSLITATVPDSTPMIFEYAYNVWLPDGSTTDEAQEWERPQVKNTVTLTGVSDGSSSEESKIEWKETQTEAGIRYDHALILYKVEEGNYGTTLPGAEFTLYDAGGNAKGTYTTNNSGFFKIEWDEKIFYYNTLYYLIETTPPTGYLTPPITERPVYCFYFSNKDDTDHHLPEAKPEGAVDLSISADQIYCENEKATTSITVDKKWLSSSGTDITSSTSGSVSFSLYQKSSTTPPGESGGSGGGSSSDGNVTVSINLGKYGPDGEIHNATYTCKSGSTVEFDVSSWGTPILKFGSDFWNSKDVIESVSQSGSEPTIFHYRFTVTESVVVTGKTDDNNLQTITVSITEPSDPKPDPSPETPEDHLVGIYSIGPNTDARGWKLTIDNLPKQETIDGSTVYYTYYIVENPGNYSTSYDNNDGIASGTITITNTLPETPAYELPATGGMGTTPLYTMGAALSLSAGLLLYSQKKRRKGDQETS